MPHVLDSILEIFYRFLTKKGESQIRRRARGVEKNLGALGLASGSVGQEVGEAAAGVLAELLPHHHLECRLVQQPVRPAQRPVLRRQGDLLRAPLAPDLSSSLLSSSSAFVAFFLFPVPALSSTLALSVPASPSSPLYSPGPYPFRSLRLQRDLHLRLRPVSPRFCLHLLTISLQVPTPFRLLPLPAGQTCVMLLKSTSVRWMHGVKSCRGQMWWVSSSFLPSLCLTPHPPTRSSSSLPSMIALQCSRHVTQHAAAAMISLSNRVLRPHRAGALADQRRRAPQAMLADGAGRLTALVRRNRDIRTAARRAHSAAPCWSCAAAAPKPRGLHRPTVGFVEISMEAGTLLEMAPFFGSPGFSAASRPRSSAA